jgi:hypothetical protein
MAINRGVESLLIGDQNCRRRKYMAKCPASPGRKRAVQSRPRSTTGRSFKPSKKTNALSPTAFEPTVFSALPRRALIPPFFTTMSRHRHRRLHLIRIGTFHSTRVYGCGHVIISLTRLNRAVAEAHRWIHRRIDLCVCPSRGTCPVHVISDDRCTRARVPGEINCVLNRRTRSTDSLGGRR